MQRVTPLDQPFWWGVAVSAEIRRCAPNLCTYSGTRSGTWACVTGVVRRSASSAKYSVIFRITQQQNVTVARSPDDYHHRFGAARRISALGEPGKTPLTRVPGKFSDGSLALRTKTRKTGAPQASQTESVALPASRVVAFSRCATLCSVRQKSHNFPTGTIQTSSPGAFSSSQMHERHPTKLQQRYAAQCAQITQRPHRGPRGRPLLCPPPE